MSAAADASALQQVMVELSARAGVDIREFFRRHGQASGFAELLMAAFPELIGPYLEAAALVSAQVYDDLAPALAYTATPVPELPADRLAGSVRWALFAPGAANPVDRLAGSATRMLMDVSRQTTLENLAAEYGVPMKELQTPGTRWARQARPDACSFCRMLATRGGVYRTEESATGVVGRSVNLSISDRRMRAAGLATTDELLDRRSKYVSARWAKKAGRSVGDTKVRNTRGSQEHGDKYHDHCFCVAVAVRPGMEYEPPDYAGRWEQDYIDAVKAAEKAGQTKGEYGAIDVNAVLRQMDAAHH